MFSWFKYTYAYFERNFKFMFNIKVAGEVLENLLLILKQNKKQTADAKGNYQEPRIGCHNILIWESNMGSYLFKARKIKIAVVLRLSLNLYVVILRRQREGQELQHSILCWRIFFSNWQVHWPLRSNLNGVLICCSWRRAVRNRNLVYKDGKMKTKEHYIFFPIRCHIGVEVIELLAV